MIIEFGKVGDFNMFLRDLLYVLNLPKVLELIEVEKVEFFYEAHRTIIIKAEKIISVGDREEWAIVADNNKIGKIVCDYIDEHFFLLGDGWRLVKDINLLDFLFRLDEKYADNKEVKNFVLSEKEKLLKYVSGEKDNVDINKNIAYFVKHFSIPIKPIKVHVNEDLPIKFISFLKRFSIEYRNEIPNENIAEIIKNIEILDVEEFKGFQLHKVDWDKIMKL